MWGRPRNAAAKLVPYLFLGSVRRHLVKFMRLFKLASPSIVSKSLAFDYSHFPIGNIDPFSSERLAFVGWKSILVLKMSAAGVNALNGFECFSAGPWMAGVDGVDRCVGVKFLWRVSHKSFKFYHTNKTKLEKEKTNGSSSEFSSKSAFRQHFLLFVLCHEGSFFASPQPKPAHTHMCECLILFLLNGKWEWWH